MEQTFSNAWEYIEYHSLLAQYSTSAYARSFGSFMTHSYLSGYFDRVCFLEGCSVKDEVFSWESPNRDKTGVVQRTGKLSKILRYLVDRDEKVMTVYNNWSYRDYMTDMDGFCSQIGANNQIPSGLEITETKGLKAIRWAYGYDNRDSVGSCMVQKPYINFYGINKDKVSIVIVKKDDIMIGRALLWTTDEGNRYLDRYYHHYVEGSGYHAHLVQWAIKNGITPISEWHYGRSSVRDAAMDNCKITMKVGKHAIPWLDTFYYIVAKDKDKRTITIMSSNETHRCIKEAQSTSGTTLVGFGLLGGDSDEYYTCDNCGDKCTEYNVYGMEDGYYCEYCYNNLFTRCEHCAEVFSSNRINEINGDMVCNDCMSRYYTTCDECGEYVLEDDITPINESLSGHLTDICSGCLENGESNGSIVRCAHCDEYTEEQYTEHIYSEDEESGELIDLHYYCDTCVKYELDNMQVCTVCKKNVTLDGDSDKIDVFPYVCPECEKEGFTKFQLKLELSE